jgi:hypothetical protein
VECHTRAGRSERELRTAAPPRDGTRWPGFRGTEDGTLEGNLREEIVGGIMLDAMYAADAMEPFYTVALGADGLLEIFIDHFRQTRTPSQGAPASTYRTSCGRSSASLRCRERRFRPSRTTAASPK